MKKLREYIEGNVQITEYTRDGKTISHVAKAFIQKQQPIEPTEPEPTLEEMQAQTLLNTEYLVARSELGIGGIE